MNVSKKWLKELVDLHCSIEEVEKLLPLRTIATKEINDQFIELDMKGYNRADLLSMRGVAYEVSAITDSPVTFKEPDPAHYVWVENDLTKLSVSVEDEQLCPLYTLAKIEGVKVKPSPQSWVEKLNDCGIRTVNNIADVTNLIMLEYGQPLHAFDASDVGNESIIIRRAYDGEKITTLDNKERILTTSDLIIADDKKALGIAGVMGGKNSEIKDSTTTVLLEAAIFDPVNLRQTTTRLNLPSEASKRFYHGLTKKRLLQALNAAIKLYEEIGGTLTGITIVGTFEDLAKKITLREQKVNSLIGVTLTAQQAEEYLKKLRFELCDTVIKNDQTSWVVTPPYFRLDIEIEEDLVEEVARMYGYENIPPKELPGEKPASIDQTEFDNLSQIRSQLVKTGLTEIQTYSFYSTNVLNTLDWKNSSREDNDKKLLIKLANPISAETEYLRNALWPNLAEKTVENLKFFEDIGIFEIGNVYWVENGKTREKLHLALSLSNTTQNPIEELWEIIKQLSPLLYKNESNIPHQIEPKTEGENLGKEGANFHPIRQCQVKLNGKKAGFIAEVHPRVINKLGSQKRIAVAEFELD